MECIVIVMFGIFRSDLRSDWFFYPHLIDYQFNNILGYLMINSSCVPGADATNYF